MLENHHSFQVLAQNNNQSNCSVLNNGINYKNQIGHKFDKSLLNEKYLLKFRMYQKRQK